MTHAVTLMPHHITVTQHYPGGVDSTETVAFDAHDIRPLVQATGYPDSSLLVECFTLLHEIARRVRAGEDLLISEPEEIEAAAEICGWAYEVLATGGE